MGEQARFKKGHARVETRVFKNNSVSKWFLDLLSHDRQLDGAKNKRACRKNALKYSYAVECGSRLRVGVRAKNASVSGFACRSF